LRPGTAMPAAALRHALFIKMPCSLLPHPSLHDAPADGLACTWSTFEHTSKTKAALLGLCSPATSFETLCRAAKKTHSDAARTLCSALNA
jgi:hypothetical protein